jgi:hypothetical protein
VVREWSPGSGDWAVGERCVWRGVALVCCRSHYAGERAIHPWDPAHGWPAKLAAVLWAPDGDVEEAKLVLVVLELIGRPAFHAKVKDRLGELMAHVTRKWATEAM